MYIKRFGWLLIVGVLLAFLAIITFTTYQVSKVKPVNIPLNIDNKQNNVLPKPVDNKPIEKKPTTKPVIPEVLPAVLNLSIPFTPQAPTANWDELHNEACEEASAIMSAAYLLDLPASFSGPDMKTKIEKLSVDFVEGEIAKLTTWQDKNFGYHLDTTAQETAQMIEGVYGLKTIVQEDYTWQDIKDQLNLNHVVILLVNGQIISNPNYKRPGPIYHMLVVRGYNHLGLITNDSGTRLGRNYSYTFDTLHQAGVDWDHLTDTIDQSKKMMIIVFKD